MVSRKRFFLREKEIILLVYIFHTCVVIFKKKKKLLAPSKRTFDGIRDSGDVWAFIRGPFYDIVFQNAWYFPLSFRHFTRLYLWMIDFFFF